MSTQSPPNNKKNLIIGIAIATALVAFLLIIASRLPADIRKTAQRAGAQITQTARQIPERKSEFSAQLKAKYADLQQYAEQESWLENFDLATTMLQAITTRNATLQALVEKNSKQDAGRILALVAEIKAELGKVEAQMAIPFARATAIKTAKNNAHKTQQAAQRQSAEQAEQYRAIAALKASATKAYPAQAAAIVTELATWEELSRSFQAAAKIIAQQSPKDNPDWAAFANAQALLQKNYPLLQAETQKVRRSLTELGQVVTKTLIDMRTDYYVTIGRTSWDNYSDYAKEHSYQYKPIPVTEPTFAYFTQLKSGTIQTNFTTRSTRSDPRSWKDARIDQLENWPSRDTTAEFWLADGQAKYYHSYLTTVDGVKKEPAGGWEEVSEAYFEAHYKHLGMDIMAKPRGVFAAAALTVAMPQGMAYVGDSKYGEWRKESNGSSFWAYYGRYSFMSNLLYGRRYYRNDWSYWRSDYRGRRPYYGPKDDINRYGTSSRGTQKNYGGSSFSRGGGFKKTPSFRGAGASRRGRGSSGLGK